VYRGARPGAPYPGTQALNSVFAASGVPPCPDLAAIRGDRIAPARPRSPPPPPVERDPPKASHPGPRAHNSSSIPK